MLGIILTAHGSYASGLLSSVNLVAGESENVTALDFTEDNQAAYVNQLKDLIDEKLKKYDELIIACDIMGGTPFNQAVMNTRGKKVAVLAGLNFQLAYEIIFSNTSIEKTVENAIKSAKDGIVEFKLEENTNEHDGI